MYEAVWVKLNIMDLEQIGIGLLVFSIGWFILSIIMLIWAYKRKGTTGLLLAFFLNWIGWIIVACMPKDDKDKTERERERELIRFRLNRAYE